jgi:hypothetical protein
MSYYIATRASHSQMVNAVGHKVGRLNQSMAGTLRRAAMALGIKQTTREGGRLEFYSVSESDYARLTDPEEKFMASLEGAGSVRPLASLLVADLNKAIDTVNAKYPGRMDYSTHQKYLLELKTTTGSLLTKLEEDVKVVKPKKPKNTNVHNVKVGDLIEIHERYSYGRGMLVRVTKVSDSSVWWEKFGPGPMGYWANAKSAKLHFKNVEVEYDLGQDGSKFFIPYAGNEHLFNTVVKEYGKDAGKIITGMRRWSGYEKPLAGYTHDYTPRD